MPYAIIRMSKFKAPAVGAIQSHDRREHPPKSNPDVNPERQSENYALMECGQNWKDFISERLQTLESKKAVRKDAVVMCQIIVTSSNDFFRDMPLEQQKEFFKESLEHLKNKFGSDNIISATVHMDEKTPHMHVNFTPIREKKLTAKTIFDRKGLIALQDDFHNEVGNKWGLKRGESREEKRRHQDVATFKKNTAEAELKRVQEELEKTKKALEDAQSINKIYEGVREGTIKAMNDAEQWSIKKAQEALQIKQEKERLEREQREKEELEKKRILEEKQKQRDREKIEKERSRGFDMGR